MIFFSNVSADRKFNIKVTVGILWKIVLKTTFWDTTEDGSDTIISIVIIITSKGLRPHA
jgi:hypothetical protein